MQNYKTLSLLLGAALLVIATAGASIYMVKQDDKAPVHQPARVVVHEAPRVNTTATRCNDGNIAGKAVGGVGGGILGSMAGKGNGKTAATIGGTLGGAYLGGETIPLNGVTCR